MMNHKEDVHVRNHVKTRIIILVIQYRTYTSVQLSVGLLGTRFFQPLFCLDKAANIKIIINLSVEQTMKFCLFSEYFNYLFGNIEIVVLP